MQAKILSVEKNDITFDDGRTMEGYAICLASKPTKLDANGNPTVRGWVPFCYVSNNKARADKFVAKKKLHPEGYVPAPDDIVDVEFEFGSSTISTVTLKQRAQMPQAAQQGK